MLEATDIARFEKDGFLVLRGAIDGVVLGREVEDALRGTRDAAGARFRFAPMMSRATPTSLRLLWRFEAIAAAVLGGAVLPVRAKGVRYVGDTSWHADSERDLESAGFLAYLEPLRDAGALRVRPGSHRGAPGPATVLATDPGDVIVMHERLEHASEGGGVRRQWRVDYVRDGDDAALRSYYAAIFPPGWDPGHDPVRWPSYGEDWLRSGHPAVHRLRELGVYEIAAINAG
jgi:hypothetical protein